ncbi:amino acid ABC transporter permease [Pelagibacterium sediminicola]|uniref:amino acid ABC transporter permease n=1 Tax=Pelagibacterium sediminicola TaxID=2248761 RepID=UPI000E31C0AA|nr:amino acid ABC transporter permease [Pelagibacterium sediminicola]
MTETLLLWIEWFPDLVGGLVISLQVTALGLIFGMPGGLALSIGARSRSKSVRWLTIAVTEIARGTPVLILLQLVYYGLPSIHLTFSSFVSACIALAICTAGYTSEIFRSGLEGVHHGQREAASSLGLTGYDKYRYVILPQAMRISTPPLLGFSILMLQASSLAFTIALPEITSQAYNIGSNTFRYTSALLLAGILFIAICGPATIGIGVLERKLDLHSRKTS